MSFPRAKLQRFNDIRDSKPSPADYNPKIQDRNCSSFFPQSERFSEPQPGSSHSDSFSVRSGNSLAIFRTPTTPKKKKLLKTPKDDQATRNLFQTPTDMEALRDKIVECNNKDIYINELTEHMEEMKLQINNLQNKSDLLIAEKSKCENKIKQLLKDYYNQIENLSLEIRDSEMIKDNNLNNLTQFKSIDDLDYLCKTIIKVYKEGLNKRNTELKNIAANVSALKKASVFEMEALKTQYDYNLQSVNADVLKIITCLKNLETVTSTNLDSRISQLQQQFTFEKTNLKHEYENQMRQIEENYRGANMQLEEKCKDIESSWQTKLWQQEQEAKDILKECQAISEYNIIQCEIEKNMVTHELAQVTKELENALQEANEMLRLKNQAELTLKIEYDKISKDLNSLREQLEQEKENHETYREQVESDKHMYEVTISKTRETIEALTKRLFDSDKDVEQLKLELDNTELSKLDLEAKYNHLSKNLDEVKRINEDLELQMESTLKFAQEKVKGVENELIQKMDLYKQTTGRAIEKMNKKLMENNGELQEVMEQLHRQQELNATSKTLVEKAREEIERLEVSNSELKLSITSLENEKVAEHQDKKNLEKDLAKQLDVNKSLQLENEQLKLQKADLELVKQVDELQEKNATYYKYGEYYKRKAEDYEKEIEQLNLANAKNSEQDKKYEALLQKYEELVVKNSQLEKKVAEQESLIGPFREQLEAYELEHRELMSRRCNAEAEAKVIGMKYAELMGHQNQKQKIKHMIDLKAKNSKLNETNMQLEQKLRAQAKLIEKLKKNLNGDKENKQNIAMNNYSPLRERN